MTDFKAAWTSEYANKGIPSSFKEDPSEAAIFFLDYLKSHHLPKGKLVDLGCGKGRNSLYFAKEGFEVTSLDFVEENIQTLKAVCEKQHLNLQPHCHDLTKPFPLPTNSFDYGMDIFCFKHLVEKKERQNYLQELQRILKPKAYYLISLASVEDGFYGPLLKDSPRAEEGIIKDPYAGVFSVLHTQETVQEEFAFGFDCVTAFEKWSRSFMHGKEYPRCVLTFILRKR